MLTIETVPSRPPTPAHLVDLRGVSGPRLSPNGRQVAFVVSSPAPGQRRPQQAIWLAGLEGSPARQLTRGQGEHSPCWSPDGGALLFVATRECSSQLHVLPLAGGEAQPLTDGPGEAMAPRWSTDARQQRLAFLRRDPVSPGEQRHRDRGEDGHLAGTGGRYQRLRVLDLTSGAERQISAPGPVHVWQYAWSPDGQELLAAVTPTPFAEQQAGTTDIVIYNLSTGAARRLCQIEGYIGSPCWSPDGTQVAFLAALEQPAHGEVVVVPAAGGPPRGLLGDRALTATWLAWPAAWRRLLVGAQVDLQSGLYALAPDGSALEPIWAPEQFGRGVWASEFSIDDNATHVATLRSGPEAAPDVWVGEIDPRSGKASGEPRRLTDCNPQVRRWRLGTTWPFAWQAADGLRLSGLLVLPPAYQPGRPVPVVVRPHGGPGMVWSDGFYASGAGWTHLLANRGIAVFMPNPRGGAGRGPTFLRANRGDLGGADYADVMSGVEALIARGIADPKRLGICGWSYGGYMTAWAITQTTRFRAAVCGAGIVNWVSYEGQCDCPQLFPRWYALEDVYHERGRSVERSPIAHVARVRTPTLILQGADDPRVPAPQAGELYQALRQLSVPVEYVCYPREGHAILERSHQLDVLSRATRWFCRYLLPD